MLERIISTRFLPISWTSPLTVAMIKVPLALLELSDFSIKGSRNATAAFMVWADCKTKGNCICPEPNNSPTTFMPSNRKILIISKGGWLFRASFRASSKPKRSPSMICWVRRFSTGKLASLDLSRLVVFPSNKVVNFVKGS